MTSFVCELVITAAKMTSDVRKMPADEILAIKRPFSSVAGILNKTRIETWTNSRLTGQHICNKGFIFAGALEYI